MTEQKTRASTVALSGVPFSAHPSYNPWPPIFIYSGTSRVLRIPLLKLMSTIQNRLILFQELPLIGWVGYLLVRIISAMKYHLRSCVEQRYVLEVVGSRDPKTGRTRFQIADRSGSTYPAWGKPYCQARLDRFALVLIRLVV